MELFIGASSGRGGSGRSGGANGLLGRGLAGRTGAKDCIGGGESGGGMIGMIESAELNRAADDPRLCRRRRRVRRRKNRPTTTDSTKVKVRTAMTAIREVDKRSGFPETPLEADASFAVLLGASPGSSTVLDGGVVDGWDELVLELVLLDDVDVGLTLVALIESVEIDAVVGGEGVSDAESTGATSSISTARWPNVISPLLAKL